MHAHHHHHPSKNVPSSNNRLSFPSNPRNPYSLNINFIYTCISSDALKFRYTFLHHHTQRTNEGRKERKKEQTECVQRKSKTRREEKSSLLSAIKDNGNWEDNRTSSPWKPFIAQRTHNVRARETHRIEIQSGCRISDAFVVHVVGRRRRHNFRFVDENSNAEFPARFHDPNTVLERNRIANHRTNYHRVVGIAIVGRGDLRFCLTVKNRFFQNRENDLSNIETRARFISIRRDLFLISLKDF